MDARPVKVSADATLVFPLIVSQTFFKEMVRRQRGGSKITTEIEAGSPGVFVSEAKAEAGCSSSGAVPKKPPNGDVVDANTTTDDR